MMSDEEHDFYADEKQFTCCGGRDAHKIGCPYEDDDDPEPEDDDEDEFPDGL